MIYFNGFSLQNEEHFFKEQLLENEFTIAGFSYGAIKAFEYALASNKRIDRLILLSPAFFQDQKTSFIRTQLRYYKLNQEVYTQQFLDNVAYPSNTSLENHLTQGTAQELEELLSYHWETKKIQELLNRGIVIEVFIGEKDKIVNAQKSFEFFKELVPCYFIKDVGHLLV